MNGVQTDPAKVGLDLQKSSCSESFWVSQDTTESLLRDMAPLAALKESLEEEWIEMASRSRGDFQQPKTYRDLSATTCLTQFQSTFMLEI